MIKLMNINIAFKEQVIFYDFSLHVKRGEKILLSAPSGRGKSTLLKSILGFQKVNKGEIYVADQKLSKETLQDIRTTIAYVSQDVELGSRNTREIFQIIGDFKLNKRINVDYEDIIGKGKMYKLPDGFLDKNINQLSGGERQRLGFIICLVLDRDIWILDEITAGLDQELKEKIVQVVMDTDKTVVISSHDDIWKAYETIRVVSL